MAKEIIRIVYWNKRASSSLNKIYDFVSEVSVNAANKLIDDIIIVTDTLPQFPLKFPVEPTIGPPFRFVVWGHYKIIYKVLVKQIRIHDVFDTRQNPGKLKK